MLKAAYVFVRMREITRSVKVRPTIKCLIAVVLGLLTPPTVKKIDFHKSKMADSVLPSISVFLFLVLLSPHFLVFGSVR